MMKSFFSAAALLLGLVAPSAVLAAPSLPGVPREVTRDLLRPVEERQSSCHTAANRACWAPGFDINTDYEVSTPNTGVTRTYTLTLTEVDNWLGPDGVVKQKVMLVNGDIFGPTITANWGDWIQVNVINNLRTNGTSIHWHGLHQKGTNMHDGANGVTECPIPPKGGSRIYRFRAQQYGTSWYHSHFSAQYGNGVVGTIVVNGPASVPYDIDLGVFPITDYYHKPADVLVEETMNGGPPPSDTVLFKGHGKNPQTGAGKFANVTLTPGKRHRLRIINTSTHDHFQLKLQNHTMTIIAADMVPVQAQTVDSLFLAVGQRYDVTIDANKSVGNYWFNATFGGGLACGASLNPHPAAVFRYQGAPNTLPTNIGTPAADANCMDLNNLTPVVSRSVPTSGFTPRPNNTLPVSLTLGGTPLFVWKVNGSSINVDWDKPIVDYVIAQNTSYPPQANVITVNSVNQWTYWLIENDPTGPFSIPHPMHLHGHDFLVVGRSPDQPAGVPQTRYRFNPATDMALLKSSNPVRRDVAMLPANGWLLIAFKSDNPGAWLFHCHIAWHVSGGLSVQYLERPNDLRNGFSQADKNQHNNNCNAWRAYWPTNPFPKIDSGLKVKKWVGEHPDWYIKN
ncbi:uncharacterized protein PODANS_5_1200 [Podospora anserina S mat+]|uniref:Laccase-2 n=5 Tax=Podospora TaxID=5144 RepID=LAC2_PODAS|nr:uncharacterized protein PODANS_5_1200 [Podospora anserina S mat+]P78722.1 RecName: Full=Laccase-2; AltName: Full=Benzenediol:oxygen oxidoreductase 2; AltName: Full=Diphenol oxidase 2; AltName: Full=Laccase C; AltName: Full=Laccase II; AltName: Full=Urishiol oxidase 2; Flags: Precursor [Podospora anserina]KAK4663974.1 laccase, multicopper oxidase, benzenediol:oxygen oxidorectuctase [Podospora pseudopauciseta]KAK4675116.1 laccase, multicopper oxidase, benzenediol:oxygen oxidorectuctase [Podospo